MESPRPKQETLGDQYRELKQKALREIRDIGGRGAVDPKATFDTYLGNAEGRLENGYSMCTAIQQLQMVGVHEDTASKILSLWIRMHQDNGDISREQH